MIRLNRITEYGLIALRHMKEKGKGSLTSARELSERYAIPYEITAKTLQKLRESAWIESTQGVRGGYRLLCGLEDIFLGDYLRLMEGPTAIATCLSVEEGPCEYRHKCEIQGFVRHLNDQVISLMDHITLGALGSVCGIQGQKEEKDSIKGREVDATTPDIS
jgi:Rrf2 family protein